jgi:hypothetical protein
MLRLVLYTAIPLAASVGVFFKVELIENLAKFMFPVFGVVLIIFAVETLIKGGAVEKLATKMGNIKPKPYREKLMILSAFITVCILAASTWYINAAIWLLQLLLMVTVVDKVKKVKKPQ